MTDNDRQFADAAMRARVAQHNLRLAAERLAAAEARFQAASDARRLADDELARLRAARAERGSK